MSATWHLTRHMNSSFFLDSLRRLYGCEEVEGSDQASACVDIASSRLQKGKFWVGDAADLSRVPSTMVWLPAWTSRIMLREPSAATSDIAKSGGMMLIAENKVLVRKSMICFRRATHKLPSNHLFISSFWQMRFPKAKVFDHDNIGWKIPMALSWNSSVILKDNEFCHTRHVEERNGSIECCVNFRVYVFPLVDSEADSFLTNANLLYGTPKLKLIVER